RDVVNYFAAVSFSQRTREFQIEFGKIDENDRVRPPRRRCIAKHSKRAPEHRQNPCDLGYADDGKVIRRNYGFDTGGSKAGSRRTEKVKFAIRCELSQCENEFRRMRVT